jgi:ABC-2 type transport system permease protein
MRQAIEVEWMKFRRSPVVLTTTVLIVVLVPLMCRGFLAAAEAEGVGAIGGKASAMVVGEGWEAYFGLLGQMLAVTLFLGPGVVTAWVFGREYADHTFGSLFALPTSRGTIAAAKFAVLFAWGVVLSGTVLLVAIALAFVTDVGDVADVAFGPAVARLGVAAVLSTLLALTIAYVASVGRGYLPAIGAIILLTAAAQIAVFVGTGGWFPYAAPGLYAVGITGEVPDVGWIQLLLVPMMVGVVAWLTIRWWRTAEVV